MQNFMSVEQARTSVRRLERICSQRATVKTLTDLAICYFVLSELPSALRLAQLAFEKNPHNPVVVNNLALIQNDLGDHSAAIRAFEMAYKELDPEDPYIALGYAESLLREKRWKEAWPIYEQAREDAKENSAILAGIPERVKRWNGKSEVGQLLLIEEGGIGDSITYSRWLPELQKRRVEWKYMPYDILRGFYERASWCGPARLVSPGEKPKVSHWTTTQSLPAIFESSESVPELPEPFTVLPQTLKKYQLEKTDLPVVGLCWSGDETRHGGRKVHSLSEGQAMRLICKTDHLVNWVNLNESPLPEPATNVKFSDLEELAGLMSNLSCIFSVETGPMCLAHALGKSLVVLLASNADWKFFLNEESPFYKGAVLLRNGPGGGLENSVSRAITYISMMYGRGRIQLVS